MLLDLVGGIALDVGAVAAPAAGEVAVNLHYLFAVNNDLGLAGLSADVLVIEHTEVLELHFKGDRAGLAYAPAVLEIPGGRGLDPVALVCDLYISGGEVGYLRACELVAGGRGDRCIKGYSKGCCGRKT